MHISIIILNISCFFRKFNKKRPYMRIYIIPNKKIRTFVTFFPCATTILLSLTSFMQLELLTPCKIFFSILIADIIYIYLLFSIKSIFFRQTHSFTFTHTPKMDWITTSSTVATATSLKLITFLTKHHNHCITLVEN